LNEVISIKVKVAVIFFYRFKGRGEKCGISGIAEVRMQEDEK
jgi:hypothetical protein